MSLLLVATPPAATPVDDGALPPGVVLQTPPAFFVTLPWGDERATTPGEDAATAFVFVATPVAFAAPAPSGDDFVATVVVTLDDAAAPLVALTTYAAPVATVAFDEMPFAVSDDSPGTPTTTWLPPSATTPAVPPDDLPSHVSDETGVALPSTIVAYATSGVGGASLADEMPFAVSDDEQAPRVDILVQLPVAHSVADGDELVVVMSDEDVSSVPRVDVVSAPVTPAAADEMPFAVADEDLQAAVVSIQQTTQQHAVIDGDELVPVLIDDDAAPLVTLAIGQTAFVAAPDEDAMPPVLLDDDAAAQAQLVAVPNALITAPADAEMPFAFADDDFTSAPVVASAASATVARTADGDELVVVVADDDAAAPATVTLLLWHIPTLVPSDERPVPPVPPVPPKPPIPAGPLTEIRGGGGSGGSGDTCFELDVSQLVCLIETDAEVPDPETAPRKKDDVRRILRRIAARLHPDANVGLDPEAQKVLTAAFVELMAAYERLEKHALTSGPDDPWAVWLGLMRATVPRVGAPRLGTGGGDRQPPAPPATTLAQLAGQAAALERRIADAEKRLGEVEQKIAAAEEKASQPATTVAAPAAKAALVRRRQRAQRRGLGFFIGALLTGVGALLGAVTKPDDDATLARDDRGLPDDAPGQGGSLPKPTRAPRAKRPFRRRRRQ